MKQILEEIETMYNGTTGINSYIDKLTETFYSKNKIIGIGAGRMGYSLRAHIMRLSQIGYSSWFIGDTTLPRIDEKSIVVINTSTGETETNVLYAKQAKNHGSFLIVITCNKFSTIGKMADMLIELPTINSFQVMKTIYEQFTWLLLDFAVDETIKNIERSDFRKKIQYNHSVLE